MAMQLVKNPVSLDRSLPHNLEAEKKVLGAMMRDIEALVIAADMITPNDFYQPSHSKIFQTILAMWNQEKAIDLVTLSAELDQRGELESSGGSFYLAELAQSIATTTNIECHTKIVKDRSLRRKLIRQCCEIMRDAYESHEDFEFIHSQAQVLIADLMIHTKTIKRFGDYCDQVIDSIKETQDYIKDYGEAVTGIKSGLPDLDRRVGGWQNKRFYIIAARPGKGKTSLAFQIADEAVHQGKKVAIFSYESDIIETGQRIFSTRYRIPLRTKINQDAYFKMMQGSQYYYRSGLWVDDTFPTLSQAINRMKRLKISEGLDLVVLDYIGLIPCDVAKSGSNREQEISTITRTLKRTAMQLDIPIIACSQLRRKEKENSEPELSDLRESGAIEQDADVVMFIHWETDQNQQIHHKLLIKKGRNIALGDIELIFSGEYTRFDCLHSDDDMPPF